MNYLGDALNKGAKASEDLKKISGDMKKNFQKLGFPSFGMKRAAMLDSGSWCHEIGIQIFATATRCKMLQRAAIPAPATA